jgi:hypothetical protein
MIADRVPAFLFRKVKNYRMANFVKELYLLIKLSKFITNSSNFLTETQWKVSLDDYIYCVRRYMILDINDTGNNYSKYAFIPGNYEHRKDSFLHYGLIKSKAHNIIKFSAEDFHQRILNCRKLNEAIKDDVTGFIKKNPGISEKDVKTRKILIDKDVKHNLSLLSSKLSYTGFMGLFWPVHYMFRHMFDGVSLP